MGRKLVVHVSAVVWRRVAQLAVEEGVSGKKMAKRLMLQCLDRETARRLSVARKRQEHE